LLKGTHNITTAETSVTEENNNYNYYCLERVEK
jgi:hypothetical protein